MSSKKNKDSGWTSRLIRIALWTLVFPALAAGAGLGAYRLWHNIRTRPEFMVDASAVSFRHAPACVKHDAMLQDLRWQLSSLHSPLSIFTSGLPQEVAEQLRESPWVKNVRQVERRLPNRLIANLQFREPVAVVTFEGGHYLVGRDGYWLPRRLYRVPDDWTPQNTPPIVNDNLASEPQPGEKWGAPAITAGARLCSFLRRSGALAEVDIQAIDVTEVGPPLDDSEIVLLTENDVRIRWGGADCYDHIAGLRQRPNYTTDAQKLQKLLEMARENPQELTQAEYLDLRYRNKVFLQIRGREKAREPSSSRPRRRKSTAPGLLTTDRGTGRVRPG